MFLTEEMMRQPWIALEYVVLDLEGTGAQHKQNEGIVDIAGIVVRSGEITEQQFRQRLNPEIEIPPFIAKIHGIRNKDVEKEPIFNDIRADLFHFLNGQILVAHNASVEWRVLHFKLPDYQPPAIFDTLRLSRALYPNACKHSLDDIIERFQIENELKRLLPDFSRRHTALFDACATALVFLRMLGEQKERVITLGDLASICALYPKHGKSKKQNEAPKQLTLFD